jgi:hypothetical protein
MERRFDRYRKRDMWEDFLRIEGKKTCTRPATEDVTRCKGQRTNFNKGIKLFRFLNARNLSSNISIEFLSHMYFHGTKNTNIKWLS